MHFYEPALALWPDDRKPLQRSERRPRSQPEGKAGERPGHFVAVRWRCANRGAACVALPGLSPAFAGT